MKASEVAELRACFKYSIKFCVLGIMMHAQKGQFKRPLGAPHTGHLRSSPIDMPTQLLKKVMNARLKLTSNLGSLPLT